MSGIGLCHRCGKWALEHLRKHSFCWECNYTPEDDVCLAPWSSLEHRHSKIAARRRSEETKAYLEAPRDFKRNEVGGGQ